MVNTFVSYLNTLHNADANNKNALAESQIMDKHYEDIFVRRSIGDYLYKKLIEESPKTIILTGHAGDGKTSLIVQILKDLDCLPPDGLKEYDFVQSDQYNRRLLYIKDMSELAMETQDDLLKKALTAPRSGNSALLISNTGPLINSMKRLFEEVEEVNVIDDFEMKILDRMDYNDEKLFKVGEYECYIINIARLDNVHIIKKMLNRIIDQKLWQDCESCNSINKCPIHNNILTIRRYKSRLIRMINVFYRYMYENDNRFTIRQIISHLSFSITGNLSCRSVPRLGEYPQFNYHFANLFFGYKKNEVRNSFLQIRTIAELNKMNLDGVGLGADFKLFVQEDYDDFDEDVHKMLENHRRSIKIEEATSKKDLKQQYRKTVRRFYILFSQICKKEEQDLIRTLFSPIYPEYLQALGGDFNRSDAKNFEKIIFDALYKLFIGISPVEQRELYLTVRSEQNVTQYVQLLKGKILSNNLSVACKRKKSVDEDFETFKIVLKIHSLDEDFPINLPLLDYFYQVSIGAVATTLNPSLSHGIDKIKSILLDNCSDQMSRSDDSKEINLLIQTERGPKVNTIEISEDRLYVN